MRLSEPITSPAAAPLRTDADVVLRHVRVPAREVDVERLARALARWYVEAVAGRRDPRSLRDLLTPAVAHRVRGAVMREAARRQTGRVTHGTVVQVRRCDVHRVGERYESLVIVDDGTRTTAVVAAMHDRGDGGWLVSDLGRPEDGVPGLPPPQVS